jgi:hypothetical protein
MNTTEDGNNYWPRLALSPGEYERAVADIVRSSGHRVADWQCST